MKCILMGSLGLLLYAGASGAQTFRPTSLVPDLGVEVFTKHEAKQYFDRDLLSEPWATVVLGRIDVYDRFPYLEARYFQVVSDPAWNRLLFGETDQGLDALDGRGTSFGPLSAPRGMAVDEYGHLFVADSGNDRVLVFDTDNEFSELTLRPSYEVTGLRRPHDVAYSDGGTPFDPSDDRLYVAETGANSIARVALREDYGEITNRLGALGSGAGRFAGPIALTVGREDGHHTSMIYVADAHSGRLVRLSDVQGQLQWQDALDETGAGIRDLDSDEFGQIYAVSTSSGSLQKFTRDLLPVAEFRTGLVAPRSIHIPTVTVHDHVRDNTERSGRGSAMVMDTWGQESGLRLFDLGVEVAQASVDADAQGSFALTDRARVEVYLFSKLGVRVANQDLGWLDSGFHDFDTRELSRNQPAGDYRIEIRATSAQNPDRGDIVAIALSTDGGGALQISRPMVLGASPNPFNPTTNIEFVVPAGASIPYRLEIVDLRGRVVRNLARGNASSGSHRVTWNGRDDSGRSVASGIYLYRLDLDGTQHSGKLALVK
jgi:FlgD Ig-like domain/NHL repeat